MEKISNRKTIVIAAATTLAALALCMVCAVVCFGIWWVHYRQPASPPEPTRAAQVTGVTATASPTAEPAVDLRGIWQQNNSMAAGWADRYHFYPSGNFHFYPNEMTCCDTKTEKIGMWKLEGSLLTLTTTKQVILSLETHPTGLCSVIAREEAALEEAIIEQYTIVDHGIMEEDFYPSVSIGGVTYWKFNDDASSYGSEQFPE